MIVADSVALVTYAAGLAYLAPDVYHFRDGLAATPVPYTLLPVVVVALIAGAATLRATSDGQSALLGESFTI
jgi:hypothetical protein